MTLRKLLLIDGLGALLSAMLLGVVLVHFQSLVGMPKATLYLLASFPVLFASYDFYVYYRIPSVQSMHLRLIAGANIAYCLLSGAFLLAHATVLTPWGWLYFLSEILLVFTLALIEFRVATRQV